MASSFSAGVRDWGVERQLDDLPKPGERCERVVCQPLGDQPGYVASATLQLSFDQRIAEPQIHRPALHPQRLCDRLWALAGEPQRNRLVVARAELMQRLGHASDCIQMTCGSTRGGSSPWPAPSEPTTAASHGIPEGAVEWRALLGSCSRSRAAVSDSLIRSIESAQVARSDSQGAALYVRPHQLRQRRAVEWFAINSDRSGERVLKDLSREQPRADHNGNSHNDRHIDSPVVSHDQQR
jgi:hypothetical protein